MKKTLIAVSVLSAVALTATLIPQKKQIAPQNVLAEESKAGSALEQLLDKNIIDGYEDGELHPEQKLTRAQFAKILRNTFKDIAVTELYFTFSDLSTDHWAHDYIQVAANAGWLEGFPDGTIRPDSEITYEQAVAVLCRASGLVSKNADYPTDYISTAIEYSLTDKVNALIGDEITREQAAQLIVNILDYKDGQITSDDDGLTFSVLGGGSTSKNYMSSTAAVEEKVAMDACYDGGALEEAYIDIPLNTEEYVASSENVFKSAVTSPLSTFSIDTDTASYSNLRRFILNGQNIPNGAVRSEELINYFDYTKAETEDGKPFGVKYTVSDCPWNTDHDLAMITVSGEELTTPKPSNLVFLIDTSGSMYDYNKLPLVKQSLSLLLDKLGENDKISIVTYASGTGVALEPTPATEKEKILNVINNLRASGSTAGASGINLAYEQAEKFRIDGNNRIILCTDGDFNVGISSTGDLEKLISEKREKGIFLSVLGFGMGNYKDNRMEILADKGNGNYAYIDNLREAKKVLVDEMSKTIYTIAKDVKIQTEFNPEKVAEYRLIGYENRLLNNEDFDNDKKDAGELGSGATVTVLYEIIPQTGEAESTLKYQTTKTSGSDELMTVKIRYKHPTEDESILTEYPVLYELTEADEDFKFASAVAELGMILNDSEFKGNATYDTVIALAGEGLGEDKFGLRGEFLQLVDLLRYQER